MTRVIGPGSRLLVVITCLAGIACQLKRPETIPGRMIEPQLLAPQGPAAQGTSGPGSPAPIRMLDTQARGHIGRRVLRQQPDGELAEDPVWRWSSAPDRYLETALRLELASSPVLQLVDIASAPTLATTLLVWHLETTGGGTRLVGAVEFQVTRADRVVQTRVVEASEAVSADLPGDLAAVAGRLLRRLAREGLTRVASER